MRIFMRTIVSASCLLLLTACSHQSYIPFTQELRYSEGFNNADLQQLQYYVCPPFRAERQFRMVEKNISSGKLIRRQGQLVHEVVVPSWTPGVAVQVDENFMAVSFEEGTALTFGVEQGVAQGDYTSLGRNKDNHFQVYYDGEWYYTVDNQATECEGQLYSQPRLWIDADSLKEKTTERKVLQGRRIE
jgi:hypothetical protein